MPVGLDGAAVRRVWDTVLQLVKQQKRVTHARLSETQVASIEGGRLQLSFTTPTLARQFASPQEVHVDVLREALREVLGVDLEIVCVAGPLHTPPASSVPGRPTGPVASAAHDGFAPDDEVVDDEAVDDADGRAAPAQRGEDAALRLVEQALGGRVVGTIEE